jgi:hypothetical protein
VDVELGKEMRGVDGGRAVGHRHILAARKRPGVAPVTLGMLIR